MLNTVGRFIYTNNGEYFMLNTGNIYLHKILGNTLCWTLWISVQHKYFWVFCVNKSSHSVQHKVFPSILCKLIFQVFNRKYFTVFCVNKSYHSDKILRNIFVEHWCRFIYTKYCGILHVEHCGNIYLHKILGSMLNTVGRFIYTKYWEVCYKSSQCST
jgi:hypothetical protein